MTESAPLRVLFLCTGNSARSQMAEALLRSLSKGRVQAFSAGTKPHSRVHPMTQSVLEERYGIDTGDLRPKTVDQFIHERFDLVVTVCDQAAETCPIFPDAAQHAHWNYEDPVTVPEDQQRRAFEHVAASLATRLRLWLALPEISSRIASR